MPFNIGVLSVTKVIIMRRQLEPMRKLKRRRMKSSSQNKICCRKSTHIRSMLEIYWSHGPVLGKQWNYKIWKIGYIIQLGNLNHQAEAGYWWGIGVNLKVLDLIMIWWAYKNLQRGMPETGDHQLDLTMEIPSINLILREDLHFLRKFM
jgi:hypothetical protein